MTVQEPRWSQTVLAEGQNVVRNGDPTHMNGPSSKTAPNTQGTVVYAKGFGAQERRRRRPERVRCGASVPDA